MKISNNSAIKYFFLLFTLPILLTFWLFFIGNEDNVDNSPYQLGLNALQKKEWKNVIQQFTECIDKQLLNNNLTLDNAYFYRATAYQALGDYQSALQDAKKGLAINPYSRSLAILISNSFMELHQLNNALAEINRRIELYIKATDIPNDQLILQRAMIYLKMNNRKKALEDVNTSIQLGNQNIYFINARALIYKQNGEYKKAIEDYSWILRLQPDEDAAYRNRAELYTKLGLQKLADKDMYQFYKLKYRRKPFKKLELIISNYFKKQD